MSTQDSAELRALLAARKLQVKLDEVQSKAHEPLAIVGLSSRLPFESLGASVWKGLSEGIDASTEIPQDRWNVEAHYDPNPAAQGKAYVKRASLLTDVDCFDARFFSISRLEAEVMDPQHRLLLETAWDAISDSGTPIDELRKGTTGVFVGVMTHDYAELVSSRELPEAYAPYAPLGTHGSFLAGRLSYVLGITGPSLIVDTACSSSLVALHLASAHLRSGKVDAALVAGVNLILSPQTVVSLCKLGALSPDGRCHSFDAAGSGYGRGEGCVVLVLKRMSDALRNGDRILAEVRGTAVNHGGMSDGLTAPNGLAHQQVIRAALRDAKMTPANVQYVEAHGTGTPLGDPIELEALGEVFREGHSKASPLAVSTLKSNIGHLEGAAGIAGLLKAVLAIQHRQIPPSLHFDHPNPHVSWDALPLRIQTKLGPWPDPSKPLVAGVSSFGMSGTNAHVIVSEPSTPPAVEARESGAAVDPTKLVPLCISAKTPEALRAYAERFVDYLETPLGPTSLHDIAFTSSARRTHLEHRLVAVGQSTEEWREKLLAYAKGDGPRGPIVGQGATSSGRAVFVFNGQGTAWWGMGRELLSQEPVFRQTIEECSTQVGKHASFSLIEELGRDAATSALQRTDIAQPALVALQLGLVRLLESWGIQPAAVVGHSVGEISAACAAGVLTLEEACRLATIRGRVMHQASGKGKMASARLSATEAEAFVAAYQGRVAVGAYNGPESVVLSGVPDAVEQAMAVLAERGVETKELKVDYAFHSAQMAPFMRELASGLDGLKPARARLPIVSTLGTTEATYDAAYWVNQMREPVRFSGAMETLLARGYDLFIEVGTHPVLLGHIEEQASRDGKQVRLVSTLRRNADQSRCMLEALSAAHCAGCRVAWAKLLSGPSQVISLPSYPWQRERYWMPDAALRTSVESGERGAARGPSTPRQENAPESPSARVIKMLQSLVGDPRELPPDASLAAAGLDSLALASIRASLVLVPGGPEFIRQLRPTTRMTEVLAFVDEGARADANAGSGEDVDTLIHLLDDLAHVEWSEVTPESVKKQRPENTLLLRGTLVDAGADRFAVAEMKFVQSHPFFYERPMDHVPGLCLIESARQLGNWIIWKTVGRLESGGTWDGAEVDFLEFVEHDEPVYLVARPNSDLAASKPLRVQLFQARRLKGVFVLYGRRIEADEYARLRQSQKAGRK